MGAADDYHREDREERKGLSFTPLHPECNYVDIMDQHFQHLLMGQPILKAIYDHDTGAGQSLTQTRPSKTTTTSRTRTTSRSWSDRPVAL